MTARLFSYKQINTSLQTKTNPIPPPNRKAKEKPNIAVGRKLKKHNSQMTKTKSPAEIMKKQMAWLQSRWSDLDSRSRCSRRSDTHPPRILHNRQLIAQGGGY